MTIDAETRMSRARAAQRQWGALSTQERAQALRPLRHAIEQRMDEIVQVISDEVGKPPMDALVGDVLVTLEQLRYDQRHASRILRRRQRGKSLVFYAGTSFFEVREPYGVVLVCAPWNYPFQLSLVPMATALIAGNAVLLKCSELTPRTARLIDELCIGAGLPEDLVQVSDEAPEDAAALLECRPDLIFFTGSSRNGRIVAARAAELTIPAVMELGGKDVALVFDSCDLERTASGVAYGSFSNAGQVCIGTKRIYVQQAIYEDFLRLFLKRVAALRFGKTIESDLGPVRFAAVRERLRQQIEDAVARGAKLHTAWRCDADATVPAVLTGVPEDAALLVEESFGPVVCIAPFQHEADAVAIANASAFALSASIWTGDKSQGERVALRLQCGSCSVNDVIRSIGNPEVAFGGNKLSGYGRYHGAEGLRTFSRVKTVMTAQLPRRTEIHWFPFQARTFSLLRGLLRIRHGKGWDRWKALWRMWSILLLLMGTARAGEPTQPSVSGGALTLEVTLPTNAHGEIAYLVFANADGFPDRRDQALLHDFIPITHPASRQRIDIGALPTGRFAVSVYLDENGNHRLDRSWLGIPKEPVGASNNPNGRLGPPDFDDCAFVHGPAAQTISIVLVSCCKR
jgi:acyl-CoA reductase-like NAD-dependent aldehyde dehydrogenase/uncharacterized protein (DUF2141 family)